ncbi:uncharacterized protein LOC128741508 isoform X2 [Sabethes cyaneus]|nr:uncharacterized protein LOC128741508 isoform X2 [Sabethes cyaneus]XP_053693355.1 uncharacterized protein LOC128741508 isoform X2 [Sabethes cyaneus]
MRGKMVWRTGETSRISCPKGMLADVGIRDADITCQSGTLFTVRSVGGYFSESMHSRNFLCTDYRLISADVQITTTPCGNGAGQLRNIGFTTVEGTFIPYIRACYNRNTDSAIYTNHTIRGIAIQYAIREDKRTTFKKSGTEQASEGSYKQKNQKERLEKLLGSDQARRFINSNSYLERGHLTPHADGIFPAWRWATYSLINAVPMWKAVNNGNWGAVEDEIRKMAERLQENVLIFTGAYDILTLPKANGAQASITLEERATEVPKWLWKIIVSPSTDSGIAFITNNDPFRTFEPVKLCTDICREYNWYKEGFTSFARGYTYCCRVRDLMNAIPAIPNDAAVSRVLRYSST